MTVIRLKQGGLWCHAPVAPTEECVRLLDELGEVKYIVLPTTALEHKVFVKDFSRKYPKASLKVGKLILFQYHKALTRPACRLAACSIQAQVWAAPDQWSWPINLPTPFRVDGTLEDGDPSAPWHQEIEQALFRPPVIGIGPANEVVFFHKVREDVDKERESESWIRQTKGKTLSSNRAAVNAAPKKEASARQSALFLPECMSPYVCM